MSTTENTEITQFLTSGEEHQKLTFTLRRELVSAEWSTIEQIGQTILNSVEVRNRPKVLVDLSELQHMGSSMVAMLVRVWKSVEGKGGAVVFVTTQNGIYEVLKLAGLTKVWTIRDNRQEGLKALGSAADGSGKFLGPFLVLLSLLSAAVAGAMLYMTLKGQHIVVNPDDEPKIQIAAGVVSGFLGFWALRSSGRFAGILGLLFGLAGIGLAVQALVN